MKQYNQVQLQGKHGIINLMIPDREPTQKEIDELHRTVAEIRVDEYKYKQLRKEKAASK